MVKQKESKVLVLTDNQQILNQLYSALSPVCTVISLSGGEGPALHASTDSTIDLIIVDLVSHQTDDQAHMADSILSLREQPLLFYVETVTDEISAQLSKINHLGFIEANTSPAFLRSLIERIISKREQRKQITSSFHRVSPGTASDKQEIPFPSLLQESERRLATLVDNLQGVVYRCLFDEHWTMKYLSDHIFELTGYKKEELLENATLSYYTIIHPDDKSSVRTLVENSIRNKTNYTVEYRIIRKNGKVRWVWEKGQLTMDVIEKALYLEGYITDITERVEKEHALKQSDERFRQLYITMTQGIVYQDRSGNITSANPAAADILGLTMDELTGRSSMNPEWRSIHEDGTEYPGETHPAMIALKTGTVQQDKIMGVFHPWKKEYRWIRVAAIPQFEFDSIAPTGVFAMFEDITELRETENRLRDQEAVFQAMLKYSPVYVFFKDQDIRSLYLSENFINLIGYPVKDAIGKTMFEHFPPEFAQKIIDDDLSIINSKRPVELEEEFGGKFYSTIKYPIIRENAPPMLGGFTIDITERKKLEMELVQARKKAEQLSDLKSNFLLLISHELRTPMTGILGYSKFIAELAQDTSLKKYASLLYQSGERLRSTVDMLLDYSVIESGAMEIELGETDIIPIVNEVCDSLEQDYLKKSLILSRDFSLQQLPLRIDKRLFRDCIYQLMSNALKYTETGAVTVEVGTEADTENMNGIIRVTDTGIGIPKESLDMIWDSFRQVSEGRGRHFEGIGLGLSIAREYIKRMNGEISAVSTPGIGSVFTITLPMFSAPVSYAAIKNSSKGPHVKTMPLNNIDFPRVLHIENDPLAVSLVQIAIGKYAIIDVAVDAAEALYKAQCSVYDLILTDINLGSGADGTMVTKQIRKIQNYEETPIIAVTAYSRMGDREEFLSAGCSHYLSKPFTRSELLSLFSAILSANPRFESLFK